MAAYTIPEDNVVSKPEQSGCGFKELLTRVE